MSSFSDLAGANTDFAHWGVGNSVSRTGLEKEQF